MMAAGIAVALLWRAAGLHDMVYEGLPGIAAGVIVGMAFPKRMRSVIVTG
jgi:hypothetical protein